ncbi:MAG: hypothetical protein HC915_11280 [Anaerolineae bacterium]|nr:hypothetical protein [Anaerolineae bacterium]
MLSTPLSANLSPFIRLFIALAAGIGLAALVEYLDTTVRTRQDLDPLALEVLGVVPGK